MPLLEKRLRAEKWFSSDQQFDEIYPLSIQTLSRRHWTPLVVARTAAQFLGAGTGMKILEKRNCVGKFCLAAAYYKPDAHFYGVEQRKSLIRHAETAKEIMRLENVFFTNGNFTQLDFKNFDHFYFYNAFYENLADTEKIDNSIDYSVELYNYYTRYLYKQLEQKPAGTKLATFHGLEDEIPRSYHEVGAEFNNLLKFWIKV